MADRALYYPYIHIRDLEWLKGTLLLFSQVRRMTPRPGPQPNDGKVLPFTEWNGEREPMLHTANLWTARPHAAQIELARRLREDAQDPNFWDQYSEFATTKGRQPGEHGFQIHQMKLHESLKEVLRDCKLAWQPGNPQPYDPGLEYVEVNPRLGEAVMATLAIACATGEGLDIVGDKRSGPLHECLTRKEGKEVYDAWLHPNQNIPDPVKPDAQELFEFVISVACDTTQLDAETLANMGQNREPIRRLMHALAERAKDMVAMDAGKERTQQFKDETKDILEAWRQDRANMDKYWKRFFGIGILDPGGKFLEKVLDKATHVAPAAAAAGALAGLALQGPLLAGGAAVGIGLFTHAAKTSSDVTKKDHDSPYRYLTLMEKAGVIIRTELRNPV